MQVSPDQYFKGGSPFTSSADNAAVEATPSSRLQSYCIILRSDILKCSGLLRSWTVHCEAPGWVELSLCRFVSKSECRKVSSSLVFLQKGYQTIPIRATHAQEGDVIGLLFPMGLAHAGISYDPSQTDNNSVSASSKSPSVGVCGEVDYFQHEAKIHCTERVCSGAFSICANVEPHDGKGFHGVASHALWSQLLASSSKGKASLLGQLDAKMTMYCTGEAVCIITAHHSWCFSVASGVLLEQANLPVIGGSSAEKLPVQQDLDCAPHCCVFDGKTNSLWLCDSDSTSACKYRGPAIPPE